MAAEVPRVPEDVEEYLVGLSAGAGAMGAGKAGARGGARGARWLRTRVEERSGVITASASDVRQRVAASITDAIELPVQAGTLRFAVPLGVTGLNQVVIDLRLDARAADQTFVLLRAFGKEGLLNRRPTAKTADRVWAAIAE